MKYTVEGFSQAEAVRLGLDVKDMVLMRWLVDFNVTGKMEVHIFDEVPFYWIKYETAAKELPILGINSPKVMSRRFKHLATAGVIETRCFEAAGNKTYFRFVQDVMGGLISDTEKQGDLFGPRVSAGGGSVLKSTNPPQHGTGSVLKSTKGRYSKVPRVGTQKYQPIDSSTIDSSINDSKQAEPAADKKNNGLPYNPATKEQIERIAELAGNIGKRFNIYKFMQTVENKVGYPPPPDVMIKACEKFIADPTIKNPWGWFVKVVRAESGQVFAQLHIQEHKQYKKETPNIGKVMQDMGVTV